MMDPHPLSPRGTVSMRAKLPEGSVLRSSAPASSSAGASSKETTARPSSLGAGPTDHFCPPPRPRQFISPAGPAEWLPKPSASIPLLETCRQFPYQAARLEQPDRRPSLSLNPLATPPAFDKLPASDALPDFSVVMYGLEAEKEQPSIDSVADSVVAVLRGSGYQGEVPFAVKAELGRGKTRGYAVMRFRFLHDAIVRSALVCPCRRS